MPAVLFIRVGGAWYLGISVSLGGFPVSRYLFKLVGVRSRLYQHRFLQVNTHFAGFFEIYTIAKLNFQNFADFPLLSLEPTDRLCVSQFFPLHRQRRAVAARLAGAKRVRLVLHTTSAPDACLLRSPGQRESLFLLVPQRFTLTSLGCEKHSSAQPLPYSRVRARRWGVVSVWAS